MEKRYDMARFLAKCLLIPGAAILLIYALNKPYKRIDSQKYLDILKFGELGSVVKEVQVGNLGSSHGAYGFAYDGYAAKGLSCFNFANTSQSFDYDYAVLKEYSQHMAKGSVLFVPISYFSFNDEVVNESEAQAMSARYYHFLSPENIPDYDPYMDLLTNRLPILSAGKDILKLFPKIDGALLVHATQGGPDPVEFAAWAKLRYSRHFEGKEEYFLPERIENLYDIIAYCRKREITPVLVTMPFSAYYTDLVSADFLAQFQETVSEIAEKTGTGYYDYSHDGRFRENLSYFLDSDHLNSEGAAYFMGILWDEVGELKRFH